MKRLISTLSACLAVAACATSPHKTVAKLDVTAPAYQTEECSAARAAAAGYKPEIGKRMLKGAAWGLVPVYGLYRSAKIDLAKDEERKRLNAGVALSCGEPHQPTGNQAQAPG